MARETAHQLGTPLSSLMGWVELLRGHAEGGGPAGSPEVRLARAELEETLEEAAAGNFDLAKKIGLKASRRIEFYSAQIDCRLLEYELYGGTRREFPAARC